MHELFEFGFVVILWVLISFMPCSTLGLGLSVMSLLTLKELFLIKLWVLHLSVDLLPLLLDLLVSQSLTRCPNDVLGCLLLLLLLPTEEVGLICWGEDHASKNIPAPLAR